MSLRGRTLQKMAKGSKSNFLSAPNMNRRNRRAIEKAGYRKCAFTICQMSAKPDDKYCGYHAKMLKK